MPENISRKKTILIPVTTGFFSRNFFRTDAYQVLKKRTDLLLVFLVPESRREYYSKEFAASGSLFISFEDASKSFQERFFKFWEVSSIHTRTASLQQMHAFFREDSQDFFVRRFFFFILARMCWFFGQFRFWRVFIRASYQSIPSQTYAEVFDEYKPDLIFCPTLLYSENRIAREAKKEGIPVIGLTHSWDNFYSKAILRVHPDRLLVHSYVIKKQAERFGDYPADKISVIGIPQYDRYFQKEGIIPREDFFERIGGDSTKKLILYAFSGKAGLSIDLEMLKVLHEVVSENKTWNAQVLIRPYPRFDLSDEKLDEIRKRYGFCAESSLYHIGVGRDAWEFNDESLSFLSSSLNYADVVINMYSTFFVEAAIFDKPLIAIAFDGERKKKYWNSARRFFEWEHLADIKRYGGIDFAKSKKELIIYIQKALNEPARLRNERVAIVREEAEFLDGKSGERLACALLRELELEPQ
ncbi:MAG: CDP-glycerol glycerophosphotransferase family protein [Patescibacteria group bacterium]